MNRQQQTQYTVYTDKAAIPGYQRAWVWGMAALAILFCGFMAGWLLGGRGDFQRPESSSRSGEGPVELARQQASNQQLQKRIAQLEQALAGDACGSAARKALTRDPGQP